MTIASHFRHFDELHPWNDRQHMLECIAATVETSDVMTFTFRSDRDNWFRYLPGQFVTLELPVSEDEPVMRTYTLSSTPSRPFSVSVTVKAQKNSIGTRWMSDCAPQSDVAFVTCARKPEDLLFKAELECLAAQMPKLALGFVVEGQNPRDGWHGLRGRIDAARLSLLAPDFRDRTVFCCGPEPFMRGVRDMLKVCGFNMERYHEESFQPAAAPAPEEIAIRAGAGEQEVDANAVATVTFTMAGKDAKCPPGQTILQTARAAGVRIGAACEGGLCGTCRVMKVSGEVDMRHNGGILDDEIEEGYILACCSRPIGDVQIEA
ncbi:iron-sulfur cluster-binding domain-containing protein [Shinella yambaruensis]|uniref:flavin reductase family protein n=1 Tax=Shinella yambaruensis TaxID=415996 RepID=UPI003D78BEEE